MALTSDPALRSNVRKRTQNPFDTEERDKVLGGDADIQGQIKGLASGLNFDVDATRTARTSLIERSAEEERNRLGRLFALDPSGIQQGRAVRGFGTVGAARLNALDQLESGLQTEALGQNRANIQSLQGVLGQQQQANLQAGALGQQALGQAQQFALGEGGLELAERTSENQFGIAERSQTLAEEIGRGTLGLSERGQSLAESVAAQTFDLTSEQLSEQISARIGAQSLTERGQDIQSSIELGRLDIAQQQIDANKEQFAQEFGLSVDQLDEARRQHGEGIALEDRQLAAAIDQFEQSIGEQQRQFDENLGLADRAQSLAEIVQNAGVEISRDTLNEAIATRIGSQDLDERGLDLQASIESGRLDLAKDQLAENQRQFDDAQTQQADQFGQQHGLSVEQFLAAKDQFDQGIALEDEALAASITQFNQQLEQQQAQYDTTVGEQQRQFDANITQQKSEFAQQFGLDEAQVFGGGPSLTFTADDMAAVGGSSFGDDNFRAEFDVNNDGTIDGTDLITIAQGQVALGNGLIQFIPEDGRRSIQQQQVDNQKAQAAQTFGLQQAQLNEASTQFEQQFTQSQSEFLSNFGNVLVDAEGNAVQIVQPDGTISQPTTLELQQFNEAKDQFDEKMSFDVEALAQQLGIDLEKADSIKFAALMSLAGSIASATGTVIAAGKNNKPGQTNFSTIPNQGFVFGVGNTDAGQFG